MSRLVLSNTETSAVDVQLCRQPAIKTGRKLAVRSGALAIKDRYETVLV